jgi:hypothetical protein
MRRSTQRHCIVTALRWSLRRPALWGDGRFRSVLGGSAARLGFHSAIAVVDTQKQAGRFLGSLLLDAARELGVLLQTALERLWLEESRRALVATRTLADRRSRRGCGSPRRARSRAARPRLAERARELDVLDALDALDEIDALDELYARAPRWRRLAAGSTPGLRSASAGCSAGAGPHGAHLAVPRGAPLASAERQHCAAHAEAEAARRSQAQAACPRRCPAAQP